jgi:hypothetical protein
MFQPARPTADRIYKKIGGYAYASVGQSLFWILQGAAASTDKASDSWRPEI